MSGVLRPQCHPSILEIQPYVGGDITPPGMTRRIALSSNENPFGPSPQVLETIQQNFHRIHLYPSGGATALRSAIADFYGLEKQHILTGNGSEELLHLLAKAYAGPGDEIVFNQYAFQVYKIATRSVGATPVFVDQPQLKTDIGALLKAVTPRTKMVYIDNPGNPVGTYVTGQELRALHAGLPPHVLLVIDAAYADYMGHVADYEDGFALAREANNVVVTRTFSKIFGLAGLRVGWAYGPDDVMDAINRIRPPFNVNNLAQAAAVTALEDQAWVKNVYEHTIKWRLWLAEKLRELGLPVASEQGNFLLIEFPAGTKHDANAAHRYLGENGIIVRPVPGYGLINYLRMTIGKAEEVEELAALLAKFLGDR